MRKPTARKVLGAMIVCAISVSARGVITPRSIDGVGNNTTNTTWGAAGTPLLRLAAPAYVDNESEPRGGGILTSLTLPSARAISNAVHDQGTTSMPSQRHLSNWVFQWGQFLDHDIDLTGSQSPAEPFNIVVPPGDPDFAPAPSIGLDRSVYDASTGGAGEPPRQQINQITSYIDASNVYGSDAQRAMNLRTGVNGKLLTSTGPDGALLPFNSASFVGGFEENANGLGAVESTLFIAGDVRANEQVGLTATHTLFVREHNRLAEIIKSISDAQNLNLTDEDIYQKARKIVGAEVQVITYNEFLPALCGPFSPNVANLAYDSGVDPTIANEFSTAAYRIGHTMLSPVLPRLDSDGAPIPAGNLALQDAFFNPDEVSTIGLDPYMRGLALGKQQEVDRFVVDDVRNFLFGPPGAGGFDLASLNIQRGRDHGLPGYNDMRIALGLTPASDYSGISSDAATQAALLAAYGPGNVNDVDLWTGGLSEDHLPDASVGELFGLMMNEQFTRLAVGDRFFYLFDPDLDSINGHPVLLQALELAFGTSNIGDISLSDIIRSNTGFTDVQGNPFFVPVPEPAVAWLMLLGSAALLRRRRPRA